VEGQVNRPRTVRERVEEYCFVLSLNRDRELDAWVSGKAGPTRTWIDQSRSLMRYCSRSCSELLEMYVSPVMVEAWDDVGLFSLGSG
jgi:hypothetical protein